MWQKLVIWLPRASRATTTSGQLERLTGSMMVGAASRWAGGREGGACGRLLDSMPPIQGYHTADNVTLRVFSLSEATDG